jgi:hypothetical protein
METTKYTQFGTLSVMIMLPIFLFSILMLFVKGFSDPGQVTVYIFLATTFFFCLLIFYKLTISIDNNYLSFCLGVGLIKRKYRLEDIAECKAVVNSPLLGIGIKKIPGGWLYNVSGLKAIELTFKNTGSKVRIGTNEPAKIAGSINKLIGSEKYESSTDSESRSGFLSSFMIISVALLIPLFIIFAGSRDTSIITNNEAISIKGMYGLTIKYSDILQADTLSNLPVIKMRTNGFAFGKSLKGNFTLTDGTRVKLFIKQGVPPYMHIKTKDLSLYFNFRDKAGTIKLFHQIENARLPIDEK